MTKSLLEELLAEAGSLSAEDRKQFVDTAVGGTKSMKWVPNPGPQTEAYLSEADILLYGGEPGGGKSQLLLGLAFNEHRESIIMRREYSALDRLITDALKIHGSRAGFNGSAPPKLRINADQVINFRAAQHVGDEQKTMGHGRDFLGIDEATHFAESQVRFLFGWIRSEHEGQRCRAVLATNPPLTSEGLWVNKMFAPWLDPNHPKPAKPGELRWVVSDADGNDEWVNGPDDLREVRGKLVRPMSRSYIPASVRDNPYYASTDYERQLDAMPEPFRSQLLGGFRTTFKDADYQVIPTAWIDAAMARWKPDGFKDYAMTAMAFDPAGGGRDSAELCWRHGGWYGPFVSAKGEETADGSASAATIVKYRRDAAPVVVDVGGGYGGQVTMRLKDNGVPFSSFNGANTNTIAKSKDGAMLKFYNKRAEAWWRFREELDPGQQDGSPIALPPDPELKADLTAPTYEVTSRGILLESKDAIRERLGRSPGKGDSAVMCLSEGNAAVKRSLNSSSSNLPAASNRGFAHIKKRMR